MKISMLFIAMIGLQVGINATLIKKVHELEMRPPQRIMVIQAAPLLEVQEKTRCGLEYEPDWEAVWNDDHTDYLCRKPKEKVQEASVQAVEQWKGKASYYSRAGCLGCSSNMIMKNGQPLDDAKLTLAFNKLPMGSKVLVKNIENGKTVVAEVTDTGGFERHGKIADLTIATRDAIECASTCDVEIEAL